jgi:ketopantoate hydroxymethyltransferase
VRARGRVGRRFSLSIEKLTPSLGEAIRGAISGYATEVRNRTFPAPEHTYAMQDDAATPQFAKGKTKTKA